MRPPCPAAKGRLIGVELFDARRHVELGDLAAAVPRWPDTPLMQIAVRRRIKNREFVAVDVARRWVGELDREQARIMLAVLDWADRLSGEVAGRVA